MGIEQTVNPRVASDGVPIYVVGMGIEIHINERIVSLRTEHNITQSELARRIGSTRQQVHTLENHPRENNLATVRRLASAFGMTVLEFLAPVPGVG